MADLGKGGPTERSWFAIQARFRTIIPPQPSIGEIAVARVPQPLVITDDMPKAKAVRYVARAFRAAIIREYGETRMLVEATYKDPKAVLASKHADTIVRALPKLIEYKLAPVSWTAFSIDVWKKYVLNGSGRWDQVPSKMRRPRKHAQPTPAWVFGKKRLEERTDWFAWFEANMRGGQLVMTKAHATLLKRHAALRKALIAEQTLDEERVRELVRAHLPKSEYARLKRLAEDDAEFEQDRLDAALRAGEWLWG